jgi:hypothetical protein
MGIMRMKVSIVLVGLLALVSTAWRQAGAQQPTDLTGTLSFNVASDGGRVESLAITIGDGGTGPYKAILAGDPGLPTHAIYRPRDLRPFGDKLKVPIVAFGNGGCRNSSGEFRNFLSDIASHGFLVVAIGPAGNAVVMGSEERTGTTEASQLMDGVDWAIKENSRQGSEYYGKIDTSKVAVMGQSCGGIQAVEVSGDPRVTTTVILNSASRRQLLGTVNAATAAEGQNARGEYGKSGVTTGNMLEVLDKLARRYNPNAEPMTIKLPASEPNQADPLLKLHGPIAYINGGPSDLAFPGAKADFDNIKNVPVLLAYQDVGHYPATFREPNGGAFAVAVSAWLEWQLRGDQTAAKMFEGKSCGFCADPKWKIEKKGIK